MEFNNAKQSLSLVVHTKGTRSVDVRRAMLNSDAINKLDNIERSVFVATTDRPISDYQDKELVTTAVDLFKWIGKDIGIRDTNSNEWKITIVRLCEILKRYYFDFSIKDIRMAFELVVTGELDCYLPKDRNGSPDKEHYQLFNAEYVCKILNAYKTMRTGIIHKAREAVPKPQKETDKMKAAHYLRLARLDAVAAYGFYKYHGYMPKLTPVGEKLLYDTLAIAGLVPPVEITEAEQKIILKRTLSSYVSKQMMGDYKRLENEGLTAEELQYDAFVLARSKEIKKAFDYLEDEDVSFASVLGL